PLGSAALGGIEPIACADRVQRATQARDRPLPRRLILLPGLLRRHEDGRVFLCHALRDALGELTLLRAGSRLPKPERRLTARFADLVWGALGALLVLRRAGEGDGPVAKLQRSEPPQLAPDGDARGRRLARDAIGKEDPLQPACDSTATVVTVV